eukprot:11072200-Karenia_brevis.AAC.1
MMVEIVCAHNQQPEASCILEGISDEDEPIWLTNAADDVISISSAEPDVISISSDHAESIEAMDAPT